MNTVSKLNFNCAKCSTPHNIEIDSTSFEHIGTDPDRAMGAEYQYEFVHEFQCECGNDIKIIIGLWEYPIGAYNYHEILSLEGVKDFKKDNNFMNVLIESCQRRL